jgi:hypothetical protein
VLFPILTRKDHHRRQGHLQGVFRIFVFDSTPDESQWTGNVLNNFLDTNVGAAGEHEGGIVHFEEAFRILEHLDIRFLKNQPIYLEISRVLDVTRDFSGT